MPKKRLVIVDLFIVRRAERHSQYLLHLYPYVQLLLLRHLSDDRQQRQKEHLVVVVLVRVDTLATVRGEDIVYLVVEGREGRLVELLRITRAHLVGRGRRGLQVLPAVGYGSGIVSEGHVVLLDHGIVDLDLVLLGLAGGDGCGTPTKK